MHARAGQNMESPLWRLPPKARSPALISAIAQCLASSNTLAAWAWWMKRCCFATWRLSTGRSAGATPSLQSLLVRRDDCPCSAGRAPLAAQLPRAPSQSSHPCAPATHGCSAGIAQPSAPGRDVWELFQVIGVREHVLSECDAAIFCKQSFVVTVTVSSHKTGAAVSAYGSTDGRLELRFRWAAQVCGLVGKLKTGVFETQMQLSPGCPVSGAAHGCMHAMPPPAGLPRLACPLLASLRWASPGVLPARRRPRWGEVCADALCRSCTGLH